MILTIGKPALLSAMIFQAKKDVRYYLNGICFAPDKKLYSTDGHRAFVGEHETDGLEHNIIIAIKGSRITRFDKAEIDTDTGIITYLDKDGIRVGVGMCEVIDGRFPDVERLISKFKSNPTTEIAFNCGYLADIEKAAKFFNPKWPGITIKTNGSVDASVIEFNGAYGRGSVVIMPMRL